MRLNLLDFSPRGWGRVIAWTIVGTAVCVAVALYVDSFNFAGMSEDELTRALLVDIFLPIGLAVPMLLFLTSKLRDLAIAHHRLAQQAATDSLTGVLNRGAFTTLVEAYIAAAGVDERKGALLVVDADFFKAINDRFGHDRGDAALQVIAAAIKGMLRGADVVGRIGGEEFGVLLPTAGLEEARAVAERIRAGVVATGFEPDGERLILSVSVGGAVFDRRLPFSDLFRVADQQLYLAKRSGRNRIFVAPVVGYDALPKAAAA